MLFTNYQRYVDAFRTYDWPGNVRELENVLMKAVVLCPGDLITFDLIADTLCDTRDLTDSAERTSALPTLHEIEKKYVARVLAATHWHRQRTAEILGISRPRLRRLIKQHSLPIPMHANGSRRKRLKVVSEAQ